MGDFTFDTREFQSALQQYSEATKKDESEILNRAGKNVAYRASQFTPVAEAATIKSGLFADDHLRFALTAMKIKERGMGVLKSPQFAQEVEKFVRSRVASRRYLKAGWAVAIEKFGGTYRGSKFRGATGEAIKATADSLITELAAILDEPTEAKAQSAESKMLPALQEALDFVARDMIDYAQRKLAKTAAKYSA